MINILHINLVAGRSGSAGLCKSIIDGLDSDHFSSHQLVGYDFVQQKNITSKYITSSSRLYRTLRYKGIIGLNFLFELMTPGCIDYKRLLGQKVYQQAHIIHLHSIQGGYFNRHDLDKISAEKKVIMTLHDDRILSGNDIDKNLFPYKTKFQYNQRLKILQSLPITYIGVSDWMTHKVQQDAIIGNNTVTTIYNGINTEIFKQTEKTKARKKLGLPLNKTISISIAGSGSQSNLKGLYYVKKLAKQYRFDQSVLFITLGNYKYNSCNNIIEFPFVSQQDMSLYFSAADIFLYPTLADSFGLVVAESLSCGCPVVTFRTGGVPEIVQYEKNGYIAQYKNYDDLFNGFKWILKNRKNLNIKLDEKFFQETMIKKYSDLYQSMV